jgi:hypothetical protein
MATSDKESLLVSRRRLLTLGGWTLLPIATIGLTGCSAPHYDSDRGLFVLQPKK